MFKGGGEAQSGVEKRSVRGGKRSTLMRREIPREMSRGR